MSGPGLPKHRAVLAAVNTEPPLAVALRASVDLRCARRTARVRPGRRNAVQPNKETSPQTWHEHFAELDAHNFSSGATSTTAC